MAYERLELQDLPYPFTHFADLRDPFPAVDMPSHLHSLLEQSKGLAHVCCQASTHPETCVDDLSQGLFVLAEYLEAALALWERWRETERPSPGQDETHAVHMLPQEERPCHAPLDSNA
jgi:hypothetical protein